jgi:hypothetical protein
MGHLDEAAFAAKLAPCGACGSNRLELMSYLDQQIPVMLAEAAGAPRWVHDGEKFIDGTYRITCAACHHVIYASDDCPRCHAANALPAIAAAASRVAAPRRCPGCNGTELTVTAFAPAVTVHAGGPARPKPLAELGDTGVHVASISCEDCGLIAEVADRCPLCDAAGPLRPRP